VKEKFVNSYQFGVPFQVKEKARSVSRDHSAAEPMGLSRQSALNDRYFDPNGANGNSKQGGGRSRSLDNLLTPVSTTKLIALVNCRTHSEKGFLPSPKSPVCPKILMYIFSMV
jgi:hypothetical protein